MEKLNFLEQLMEQETANVIHSGQPETSNLMQLVQDKNIVLSGIKDNIIFTTPPVFLTLSDEEEKVFTKILSSAPRDITDRRMLKQYIVQHPLYQKLREMYVHLDKETKIKNNGIFCKLNIEQYLPYKNLLVRNYIYIHELPLLYAKAVRFGYNIFLADKKVQAVWQKIVRIAENHNPPSILESNDPSFVLTPYQISGVQKILQVYRQHKLYKGILLADAMGAGKTAQTLIALRNILLGRSLYNISNTPTILIVVPASVLHVWQQAINRHIGDDVEVVLWQQYSSDITPSKPLIVLSSHSHVALQKIANIRKRKKWNIIVVDEAHEFRNLQAKRTKTILSFDYDFVFLLTGTPMVNLVNDLLFIIMMINPVYKDFNTYRLSTIMNLRYHRYKTIKLIQQKKNTRCFLRPMNFIEGRQELIPETIIPLTPVLVRRDTASIAKIPDIKRHLHVIPYRELVTQQLLKQYNEYLYKKIHKILLTATELKEFTEILQTIGKAKVHYLTNNIFVSYLQQNMQHYQQYQTFNTPLLFFTRYRETSQILQEQLIKILQELATEYKINSFEPEQHVAIIDGKIPPKKRLQILQTRPPFIIASIRATGVGINIPYIRHVHFVELDWNAAMMEQAESRVRRLTSPYSSIHAYYYFISESYEKRMFDLIISKSAISASLNNIKDKQHLHNTYAKELNIAALEHFGIRNTDVSYVYEKGRISYTPSV